MHKMLPCLSRSSPRKAAGSLGFEPRKAVLETAVIPFHHEPMEVLYQEETRKKKIGRFLCLVLLVVADATDTKSALDLARVGCLKT